MIECGEVNLIKADFSAFKYVLRCEHCGDDFGAMSARALYCSPNCRKISWARSNKDKVIIQAARSRKKNIEKTRERNRRWNKENSDRLRETGRIWRLQNPHKNAEYKNKKKLKKSQLDTLDAISQIRNNNLINSTGETR